MNIYTVALTLILIMDPFGNIPIFLGILGKFTPAKRRLIIIRESLIAFVILIFFLFFGRHILNGLHIEQAALNISGGVVLFIIALKMIFPARSGGTEESFDDDPLIVPLAVPMLAGPSSTAYVMLVSAQYPDHLITILISIIIAAAVTSLVLVLSDSIRKILGTRILKAIERLMGMILTTLAVQMLLSGIGAYFGLSG